MWRNQVFGAESPAPQTVDFRRGPPPTQTAVGLMQTFTWSMANRNRIELVEDSGTADATLTYKTPAYDAWLMAGQKPAWPPMGF